MRTLTTRPRTIQSYINNRLMVFLYFLAINFPLIIFTFNTGDWSDDYQYIHLLFLKAKFSPLLPLLMEAGGFHYAPIYNLFNFVISSIFLNSVFFHLVIVGCFIATAFFIYLMTRYHFQDSAMALLAGTLFSINYHTAFKALTWNVFHSHVTNTLTGVVGIYFLFRYLKENRKTLLFFVVFLLLASIHNYETGFVFYPVFLLITFFYKRKGSISLKKALLLATLFTSILPIYFIGSRFFTGQWNLLAYRFNFENPKWTRDAQNYAFTMNNLFVNSSGLSMAYNKLIFDPLYENEPLRESMSKIIREHDIQAVKNIPIPFIFLFAALGLATILFGIFLCVMIWSRIREETRLFVYGFICLFLTYSFIFYRADIANALSVFSSIVIADFILSFFRERPLAKIGMGILGLYVMLTAWTCVDGFEDAYQKSFFYFPRTTIAALDKIYTDMNRKIGHFIERGLILFVHDYSKYKNTTGHDRIGLMFDSLGDFTAYNAAVFHEDFLKTDIPQEYRHKSFRDFMNLFSNYPNNRKVIVNSKEDAIEYIRDHAIDLNSVDLIYLSRDYDVTYLNEEIGGVTPTSI